DHPRHQGSGAHETEQPHREHDDGDDDLDDGETLAIVHCRITLPTWLIITESVITFPTILIVTTWKVVAMPRGSYTTVLADGVSFTLKSSPTSFLVPTCTEAAGGLTPQAVTQALSTVSCNVAEQPRCTAAPRAVAAIVASSALALRTFCLSSAFRSLGRPNAAITPMMI